MRRKPPLKRDLGGIHGARKGIESPQTFSEFSVMVACPSHPLDGCWAKIERVKEQIRHLNGEIAALINSGVYTVAGENQPDRDRYAFKLLGPPVPLRIAVVAGEIVHHLRSCFDHVVWALARKNGLPDSERANFPVCQSPEKFKNAVRDGIIKGVSASEHPLIEALQPYRLPDPPNSILQIVHDLDITDKHRLSWWS